jgi:lipoprotein signal peptidase
MPSNGLVAFRSFNRTLCILAVLCALDQWSKEYFADQVILNTGVSFSLLSSVPPVWLTASLLLLTGVLWWVMRPLLARGNWAVWGGYFFFGGSLSNLFDRARFGGVRDIWLIPGTQIHNNLADWFIAIGVFALIISTLFSSPSIKKGRGEQGSGPHES